MTKSSRILLFISFYAVANASVMLWSNKNIKLSPFQVFDDESLACLTAILKNPKTIVYKGSFKDLEPKLPNILQADYSSYIPNDNLNVGDIIDLTKNGYDELKLLEDDVKNRQEENYLVIMIDRKRFKRSTDESIESSTEAPPTGSMMYSKGDGMIYTVKPPILLINYTKIILGKAAMITLNKRDSTTKISIKIPTEDGNIMLNFIYSWYSGYWTFTYLNLLTMDSKTFNLTTRDVIMAPRNFSYHCQGEMVFQNEENSVSLTLFDMQMQPDAYDYSFGDAYDCIPFMTGPIWSGLFVTTLLTIVLAMGLLALGSIKTMDKFETNKSKQLVITLNE